jgi:mannose-binding lectin 2
LSDNLDIIMVANKNLYDTKGREGNAMKSSSDGKQDSKPSKSRGKKDSTGGSWTWFLFKIVLFFMVLGGGYVGYTAWRTQQRRSHRF